VNLAIVGGGRAGSARARALAQHPEARLWGTVHRAGEPTLAQALADGSVDAVAVCTPNVLHAQQVQAALAAGKHVLCEYPLAATAGEGRALFEAARSRGRVLHVGHIELLAESHRVQRERAAELGRPLGGAVEFTASSEGWIGDGSLAGSPGLRATARLHRLVDLFGSARVRAAALEESAGGYRLEVELGFEAGGEARLCERRAPGCERRTTCAIRCERGLLGDPPPLSAAGVFRADLDCFVARVAGGAPPYLAEERILHVLALVERIDALTGRER
jgi:predicted dehydrogenase